MSNEKTGADLIVEKLSENKSQIESLTENVVNEFKSVGDKITLAFAEVKSKEAQEEIKSLKDQIANKDNKIAALSSSGGVGANNVEVKSMLTKAFSDISTEKSFRVKNLPKFLEEKSGGIVGFDARRGGIFVKQPKVYGEIIDLFPRAKGIASLINTVNSPYNLKVNRKDTSKTEIYQKIENQVSQSTKPTEYTQIDINQATDSVIIPVSSDMIREVNRGLASFDLISNQINDLVDLYNFRKDKLVVDKAIAKSQQTGNVVKVKVSANSAAADQSFADILAAYSKFEQFYRTPNVVFAADQSYLDQVFAKLASDGHGNMEYFNITNEGGFTSLKTANGSIRLVPVDSSFFKGYKLFDNSGLPTSTLATEGYVFGGSNGGKVLGMFIDLNKTMLFSEDADAFEVGLYQDSKDLHKEEAFLGIYGSYGTEVILEASMGILTNKN